MKKLLFRALLAILLIVLGTGLSAYAYVHTESFKNYISDTLSNLLGESVELGEELSIDAFYPKIRITLPNAKLRTSGATDTLNRARLQNLAIDIGYKVVTSGGTEGNVNISADSISVITRSGQSASSTDESTDDVSLSNRPTDTIAHQIKSIRQQLSGLDITLSIAELNYFDRNQQSGNNAYHLGDIQVNSLFGNTVQATANLLEDELPTQSFVLKILSEPMIALQADTPLMGTFAVDINSESEQHIPHVLNGNWTVDENNLSIEALEYKSDDAWLRGNVAMQYSTQNIDINADFDVRQWFIDIPDAATTATAEVAPPPRLFAYDVFSGVLPAMLTANVDLYLGAIRLGGTPVVNGGLTFQLENGILNVSSNELSLLGGSTELSLEIDNSQPEFVKLDVKLEADDIQLERIRSSTDDEAILSRGEADMILALRGDGLSPGHIASSLNGYVIATISAAQVKQKYSTLLDVGVLNWAVDKISMLAKNEDAERKSAKLSDPLTIDCASLRLYVNDGRVEVANGAVIELMDNVLFSSGYIDLKDETLGFAFRTKSRNIFDWSAISIAKYAEVGGFLAQPAVTLNARELAKQGLLSASNVVWGPLPGLVYSLAESGVKNMQSAQCTPEID